MSELSNKIDQVRDILRTDDGISGAMDYTQAISWVLFLNSWTTMNSKMMKFFGKQNLNL